MAKQLHEWELKIIYPLYLQKITKKERTETELLEVINWLTGYSEEEVKTLVDSEIILDEFFKKAPMLNENRNLITGKVCGVKVEEIEDTITREIRYLDKLVDELAKGKQMDKILRK